ncbi:ABC transporter ATP-binding protein [Desertimonas flava]|uniref:ABC transporter ATP-binding protein n=1 Tax=Desertimonas flava TaxID=2064846 RepID=UPI000E347BC7|nr:oligopeptide/dipeptide ABC transporter ATP-binding protein [Desertimonas flava]
MAGSGTAHLRERTAGTMGDDDLVLQVEHLVVEYGSQRGTVHAVSDVSFDLADRETLGIVGESGCGKSTTGKAIMRVPPPTSGSVHLNGVDMASLSTDQLREARTKLQMIFQDAISSLNPRRTIREIVGEPLVIRHLDRFPQSPVIRAWHWFVPRMVRLWRHPIVSKAAGVLLSAFFVGLVLRIAATAIGTEGEDGVRDGGVAATIGNVIMGVALSLLSPIALLFVGGAVIWTILTVLMPVSAIPRTIRLRRARAAFEADTEQRVRRVLDDVGIDPDAALDRRPHEFSGGQAQRISIARALILDPEVIICDEPVSALDVSVQAQVLNLLEDLKVKYGISLVFIAHDLAVVKNISDRVVVMYLGKVCEVASPDDLFNRPRHPYTEILVSSIPITDPSIDPRDAISVTGDLPSPLAPPSGCRFRTRCPRAADRCAVDEPELRELSPDQFVACHFPL